jgi:hypothetical protein
MNLHLASRAAVLFSAGMALVLALNLLQVHRQSAAEGVWLAVPLLAAAATVVGLLYPLALSPTSAPDGSTVMRCLAVFVGIYQATTKIDFSGYVELAATLAALSAGIWWLFDRSGPGLALSLVFTMISAAFTHFLLHFSILTSMNPGYLYSRLWCLYFSGCITFGAIGRRLAAND